MPLLFVLDEQQRPVGINLLCILARSEHEVAPFELERVRYVLQYMDL